MAEKPNPHFTKRVVRLPDGRELVYYDQLPPTPRRPAKAGEAAPPSRSEEA